VYLGFDQAPFRPLVDWSILMGLGPTYSRRALLQIFLVSEVSTQVLLACMDLRPQTLLEA
jgi:hypothetical protein